MLEGKRAGCLLSSCPVGLAGPLCETRHWTRWTDGPALYFIAICSSLYGLVQEGGSLFLLSLNPQTDWHWQVLGSPSTILRPCWEAIRNQRTPHPTPYPFLTYCIVLLCCPLEKIHSGLGYSTYWHSRTVLLVAHHVCSVIFKVAMFALAAKEKIRARKSHRQLCCVRKTL